MPITVLGKTFPTEAERREYFRNELRRKLPELKQLEGFPIGEDEDIIALSDPPYYTACPNPWLNDFIAEWEAEKKELERQDKRQADFAVHEPYASDVSEGKNNPIYNAHGYHTKVPHPAIMRYILHYTQPGDIILDGFAGTGMTGVAAQMCGHPDADTKYKIEQESKQQGQEPPVWGYRKAILGDLSPIASFIAYNYNTPVDLLSLKQEAKRILAEVEEECGWMYQTRHMDGRKGKINYTVWSDVFLCSNCGGEMVFWEVAVDQKLGKVHNEFSCPNCQALNTKRTVNKTWETYYDAPLSKTRQRTKTTPVLINYSVGTRRHEKRPDQEDKALLQHIHSIEIPYWFPTDKMMGIGEKWGDTWRAGVHAGISYVHHFYTKRNLWVLANLWERTQNFSHLRWTLSGIMQRGSIQHQVAISRVGGPKAGEGGKTAGHRRGTLYVPSNQVEFSVIELFKSRVKAVLKSLFDKDAMNLIYTSSATNLNIKDNTVDYVFVDPPFGDNIMYSELNYNWDSWLRVKTNNRMEAIENRTQRKGLMEYNNLMTSCFREYYRVLKRGKCMTVEFSNTSAAVWNSIQTAIQQAGFIISTVTSLDKKQQTHSARTSPTAVKQDLVISCYKPSSDFDQKFRQNQYNDVGVWDFVEEHLNHLPVHLVKDNSTTAIIERSPKILFDRLIAFYVQRSLPVPIDAGKFQIGLKERFVERDGMYFTPGQAAEYDRKKAEAPNFIQASLFVSSEQDGVLFLKNLLERKPLTYQDIHPHWMQALAGQRKGDIIPELMDILQENFLKDAQGRWYAPDPENEADLEALRNRRLLKQFGEYAEIARQPKGKLKEARVEALRAGFRQCYQEKDFKTIVQLAECLQRSRLDNLLMEDEVLLQFYDIAGTRV